MRRSQSWIRLLLTAAMSAAPAVGPCIEVPTAEDGRPHSGSDTWATRSSPDGAQPEKTTSPDQVFEILSSSVDGGGGTLSGGSFSVSGTSGEPEDGVVSRCEFAFSGGLQSSPALEISGSWIFCDGFEKGDTGAWASKH